MKRFILNSLLVLSLSASLSAQIVLDNFNSDTAPNEGAVLDGTSWIGQVNQNAGTISIGGSAKDDNGWGIVGTQVDGSAFDQISIRGQLDSGNSALFVSVQFLDANFATTTFTVSTSAFTLGTISTVVIPVAWTGFDATQIIGWNIGGGVPSPGGVSFRMTFDELSLTSSAAAIPEPSTYAAIFGALALGLVAYRRRMVRTA